MLKSYINPDERTEATRKLPRLMVEGLLLGGTGLGVLALIFEIAADAFPGLAAICDPGQRCTAFIQSLADLSARLGMPTRLRDVDIPRSALGQMAADAMLQTRLLVNNPRPLGESDALRIYEEAW